MNYEETLSTLKAIQASYSPMPFLLDPDVEPRFVINSDERTISIPEEFKFLAVKMDHLSERIYFDIPRYFDGEDLATKICVVQYINANGEEVVEGIAAIVDVDYKSESGKIIFRWDVDNNVTKYAGDVSFSVRFYTISDDNRFTYSWNTIPTTLPILDTLDNTGKTVIENYPTELLQWQYRMTELDRTITDKINSATASIDADVKAAQESRKGAEDAEARVNAIVAANEAYTKKQSHDLFALALRGTAEAAKSITIYPDKGSNAVITAHGFTKQEGSGDPSPGNNRPIVNGGLKLVKLVINGSTPGLGVRSSHPSNGISGFITGAGGLYEGAVYSETLPTGTSTDYIENTKNAYVYITSSGSIGFALPYYSADKTLSSMQSFLNTKPLTVYFQPADESQATGLYIPLIGTGDGHTGICAEIAAKICQGDMLVTNVKSGCDKVKTVSATRYGTGVSTGGLSWSDIRMDDISSICEIVYSSEYPFISNTDRAWGSKIPCITLLVEDGVATGVRLYAFGSDFSNGPINFRLWYQSNKYTTDNDKKISLESHVRWIITPPGAGWWKQDYVTQYETYARYIPIGRCPSVKAKSTALCSRFKCYKDDSSYGTRYGEGVYTFDGITFDLVVLKSNYETLDAWEDQVDAWAAEGNPIQLEYELAVPLIYAHDPVDFVASPDEDGAWVITGEADGTVSAEYNKNVTKAFEELLTRVSALELHALGG